MHKQTVEETETVLDTYLLGLGTPVKNLTKTTTLHIMYLETT